MVLLQALDGSGNLIPVLLDSSGKIISVLQGTDGSTLRTLKVDSAGQLIAILKGASGNNVGVDSNGFLTVNMKGQNAGNPVTVAVDADGNIIAVMKGDYSGTLKTISTDDQGRMLAKIFDPDDVFGSSYAVGLGEHAARVGSIMSYDRRGQYFWGDDFESPVLKWGTVLSGTGAAVILDTSRAHTKERSCKLIPGSTSGKTAQLVKNIQYINASRIGAEISFHAGAFPTDAFVDVTISKYDGTNKKTAAITYTPTAGTLVYQNSGGGSTTFATGLPSVTTYQFWYPLKVVADFSTLKYIRVAFMDTVYDLSANSMYSTADTSAKRTEVVITAYDPSAASNPVWVDDFLFTVNEP